jgi:2-isopropylmalate synthase
VPGNTPYVGASAFAHKGGMHIDGVSKLSSSFEHISPETVGNTRRFLMSEVSGRSMVMRKLATVAPESDARFRGSGRHFSAGEGAGKRRLSV